MATLHTSSRTVIRCRAWPNQRCRWATHVGRMIEADLAGKARPAFRYFDKGDMATIGRLAAVAKVEWPFKAHMSGLFAWLTWIMSTSSF